MVIITISTVGYQEIHPQGGAGRIFTSTLIVVGVATMLYGFGVFAETLAENAFGNYRRERQLERNLNQLRGHFIICGYGRIGTQIVAEFEERKVPYAGIDQREEAVGRLRAEGRLHLEGDASSEELLKQAGIERARGLISAVDSDERAGYIVLAARAPRARRGDKDDLSIPDGRASHRRARRPPGTRRRPGHASPRRAGNRCGGDARGSGHGGCRQDRCRGRVVGSVGGEAARVAPPGRDAVCEPLL